MWLSPTLRRTSEFKTISVPNQYGVRVESHGSCALSKGQTLKYISAHELCSKPVSSYQCAFMGTGSEVKTQAVR